ncbi:MAG TPA: hypothetical protein VFM63_03565 [Pyrinomonadaceae bacterium]|nr:hypothetical protein [Pyrinomonadaceae bacterium]
MKRTVKYVLSAFGAVALSLTLANAVASACTLEVSDEYTCYVTGEDANYCYYTCYCKVSSGACRDALVRDGFEILN